jgi:hypothetical protein
VDLSLSFDVLQLSPSELVHSSNVSDRVHPATSAFSTACAYTSLHLHLQFPGVKVVRNSLGAGEKGVSQVAQTTSTLSFETAMYCGYSSSDRTSFTPVSKFVIGR